MRVSFKILFIFCLSLVASSRMGVAQRIHIEEFPIDSSVLSSTIDFDQERINAYLEDRAYRYVESPKTHRTYWERIKDWLYDRFMRGLSSEGTSLALRILIYGLGVVATGLLFFYLFNARKRITMKRGDVAVGEVFANPTEIERQQFLIWMEQAENDGDYNLAMKYLYLFWLRQLDEKNIVRYLSSMTNRIILQRIEENAMHSLFKQIARNFEFVWFGQYKMEAEQYHELKRETMKSPIAR